MLPETVAEKAAGRSVAVTRLFEFQFFSGTSRFWDGARYLSAGGREWLGIGELIGVSGMEQAASMSASQAVFSLSGASDELIALAVQSEAEVTGRPCAVYIQFLTAEYTPLDQPIALWAGTMDVMSYQVPDLKQRNISLTAEGLFADRVRAPHGYMTDTDQQARWPGDRGMEFMPALVNKTVNWLRG